MQIYIIDILPESKLYTENLLHMVSQEKSEKLNNYKSEIDKKLSLYGELLVRYKICVEMGIRNNEIVFCKNTHGKPYLKSYPYFNYNISHSKAMTAVVFSTLEVGIDIEFIGLANMRVVKRCFHPSERSYIYDSNRKDRAFYEIWTKKEAYVKYTGTGLFVPFVSFSVLDGEIPAMMRIFEINGYIITVCCKNGVYEKPEIIILTEENALALFTGTQSFSKYT